MRVLTCVVEDHNWMLVALAALVCVIGSVITMSLFRKMHGTSGLTRATWLVTGAGAGGAAIWCTHFIAMLAWTPSMVTAYEPAATAASLVVALAGCALALGIGSLKGTAPRLAGGALFGLSVSAMHYLGMAGLENRAFLLFDPTYVIVSVVLAIGLGMAAFSLASRRKAIQANVLGSLALVGAIVSLHFTGMAAVTVLPMDAALQTSGVSHSLLAFGVAGVGMLLLGSALATYALQDQTQKREHRRLNALIDGAADGMVIEIDGDIVTANEAFVSLCGLISADLRGTPIARWIEDAEAMTGQAVVQSQLRTVDGEQVPVEVTVRHERGEGGVAVRLFAVRDLRRRLEQERRIAFLARNDSLTGLPNRASFLEKMARMTQLLAGGGRFALFAIDLDRFKDVNDLYGHAVGDQLLVHIAGNLKRASQEGEFIARLGGDEFIGLVPLKPEADEAHIRAAAMRWIEAIQIPMSSEHTDVGCGASVGVAVWPTDAEDASILINNADLAMYRAKASLHDKVCFYEKAMDEAVRHRRRVTQGLREALEQEQFQIYYQPQVSVSGGDITGYEALLRWPQADGSFVPPDQFIPVAEDSGLILPIGEWVLRRACQEAMLWDKPLRLAVNLSPVQLGHADLPRLVQQILLETGLSPSRLELEITETAMISDMVRSTHILRQLKALGVSIAMDDFGTGYSSLSTLRAFPFDKIKLDRAFMTELGGSPQSRAIIRAVLTIGESLNIPVLAEGVETPDQLDFLREQGCDEVQGFLLGRPMRDARPLKDATTAFAEAG
ncbi:MULTISPECIES: bifunctional diguanylate cyclase/phosphodiesterase [unclassified Brevundimonas]|uniref:bifunctional diguanylate cyclase/phosphodiesterase n=1 Tax=unclassified Brevundimonas TaxID=2622653 RepID=UPI0025BFD323|nr:MULTISPECIES: EAL domain-containing protein [unclassified Brevundimonas]